jgi:hypothetical protein
VKVTAAPRGMTAGPSYVHACPSKVTVAEIAAGVAVAAPGVAAAGVVVAGPSVAAGEALPLHAATISTSAPMSVVKRLMTHRLLLPVARSPFDRASSSILPPVG